MIFLYLFWTDSMLLHFVSILYLLIIFTLHELRVSFIDREAYRNFHQEYEIQLPRISHTIRRRYS